MWCTCMIVIAGSQFSRVDPPDFRRHWSSWWGCSAKVELEFPKGKIYACKSDFFICCAESRTSDKI